MLRLDQTLYSQPWTSWSLQVDTVATVTTESFSSWMAAAVYTNSSRPPTVNVGPGGETFLGFGQIEKMAFKVSTPDY